jgi:hypothetical protein
VSSSAQVQNGAIRQDDLQTKHIITCYTVLKASRPTGVCGDVAANGILFFAGRIRRVKQPALFNRFRQQLCVDPGFDDRNEIRRVDFFDPIHPGQGKHNATPNWNTAADVTMSGTSRCYRHAVPVGELQ